MISIEKADTPLHGTIKVPGDKSITHRAVMFSSLSTGDTHITGFLNGADCLSTIDCFRRLGVNIEVDDEACEVTVHGKGLHGLKSENTVPLYTGNSGTTTRIISGILAPQQFTTILSGDDSVNQRPMKRIIEPLSKMGADIKSKNDNGCAPLIIKGSKLQGITWKSAVASAQVKSAVICAGLYADSDTTVIEPALSRDHTERMLSSLGAHITTTKEADGYHVTVSPADVLISVGDIAVPGDISSAAFFMVAALIVPGSEVLLENVGVNPTRSGIIDVLKDMGGNIELTNNRTVAGEPVADIVVKYSSLHGTTIYGDMIPALIDELPVIAVAAAFADGTTTIKDAAELRVKESDRIDAVVEGLASMGADIEALEDGMIIHGVAPDSINASANKCGCGNVVNGGAINNYALHGARISCHKDHRIAMSFAVCALAADGTTILDDETCVNISYPGFFKDLVKIHSITK